MTYLSMRMREIRSEEARRKNPALTVGVDFGFGQSSMVLYDNSRMHLLQDQRMVNPISWGGRAG